MDNLEIIQTLRMSTFVDEDGAQFQLEFQPPLNEQQLDDLVARFPNRSLPDELKELAGITGGWSDVPDGWPEDFALVGLEEFAFDELSQHSITLGHDGFGNHWILDISPTGQLRRSFGRVPSFVSALASFRLRS